MSREIVLAVDVAADTDDVYETLTTQDGLAAFWTPDVTASPEPGSTLRFGFEPAPIDLEVTLEAADPGERVVWVVGETWPHWSGTTVTWSFADSPEDGATRVVMVHDGFPDDYPDAEFGSVAFTWSLVVGALQRYHRTGTADPALR